MKYITRKNLMLCIFTLLGIFFIFLLRYSGNIQNDFIQIGSIRIPATAKQGLISGLSSLVYISLVFTDYKKGIKISFALLSIAFINLLYGIINKKALSSLPGLITNIVAVFTVIIIYSFYKRLSISNLTDYVTGHGNRRSYVKIINEHINAKKAFTVACVELEEFKHINDLYGIQTGDFLLKKTTEKISSILNKNDKIFRITGSTFAVIFEPGESPENRLRKILVPEVVTFPLQNEATKNETSCVLNLRAGLVYSNPPYNDKTTASRILNEAETALVATRNTVDKRFYIYDESMKNSEVEQRNAEALVQEALKGDYFYLVYQPQYTTSEKKLRGFETLIRCRKPNGTIISPNYFIPAAEKSNLIMKIDEYVLKKAMKEFKPLIENSNSDLILSINVSAKNMSSADFADRVKLLIGELRFPPDNLEIEITEYSFAESMETTVSNIDKLHEIGVQIALDDFGTGYTSIHQMMKLPINLLKIDKSLIDDIEENQILRDIVDSVIYMGHIMNCEVISEGVEKIEQLNILKEHKCDFIQGYIWGKPVCLDDAKTLSETN